ncbi:MAG: glutamate--cysteine ligase [Acetobacteraceae bacterium]|nr:glutamate--cysteine ligase [Acetobacteraceae bacterium]
MSNPGEADLTPITSVQQMAEYLAEGCKPSAAFRIGTEHEKFGFRLSDLSSPPYEPNGIRAMLEGIGNDGWDWIEDHGNPIGLKRGYESVSLEPAGQFELSGAPLESLHDTAAELESHYADVRRIAAPLGLGFAALGFHPTQSFAQMPWMPKSRYGIMRRYMPKVGALGLDMMTRTCTVQVNLDFSSEADMAAKLKVSLALQPVATALFANSPFKEGKPSGFLSTRAQVWTDTDTARSGMPGLMFAEDFGFERYVDWVLDVPMYFVMRDGEMIDLAGASFRDFVAGRLDHPGVGQATMGDFADHITTAFTDVRLKRFLEMRGADAGTAAMMVAQSALWVGLLYDEPTLAAALSLVRKHPWEVYQALRPDVARNALGAKFGTGTLRDVAREMVELAAQGLRNRARVNGAGEDETKFLAPLFDIIHGAPTQAEYWLGRFNGAWRGDVTKIFGEAAI